MKYTLFSGNKQGISGISPLKGIVICPDMPPSYPSEPAFKGKLLPSSLIRDLFGGEGFELAGWQFTDHSALVLSHLEKLSPELKELIRLRYDEGRTINAIAVILGCSASKVRRNLAISLHSLRLACNTAYRQLLDRRLPPFHV